MQINVHQLDESTCMLHVEQLCMSVFSPFLFFSVVNFFFFQSDLLQLVQPFGAVSKLVMLRAKNQVYFFPWSQIFSLILGTVSITLGSLVTNILKKKL